MKTRSAGTKSSGLQTASMLSSPPTTLTKKPKLLGASKKGHADPKKIKVKELVKVDWDALPHGIGKKGDLVTNDPSVDHVKTELNDSLAPAKIKTGKL